MTINKLTKIIFGAIVLLVVVWAVVVFRDILSYILIAWVLSIIGAPMVEYLTTIRAKKFRLNRTMAALTTLVTFLLVLYLVASFIVPLIIHEAKHLSEIGMDDISSSIRGPVLKMEDWLKQRSLVEDDRSLELELQNLLTKSFHPKTIIQYFQSLVGTIGDLFIALFSILFISFYFLKDKNLFGRMITSVIPDAYVDGSHSVLLQTRKMLSRYFGGLVVQAVIFTLMCYVTLAIIGFKNALLIAFIAGLLNVVPYVGPLIGMLFGTFITVSSYAGMDFSSVLLPKILVLIGVILAVQQIDGLVVQPNVIGKSVQAHPLEIFLVVLVGGKLAGLPGLILAIPAYTVLRIIGRNFFGEWKAVKSLTESLDPNKKI